MYKQSEVHNSLGLGNRCTCCLLVQVGWPQIQLPAFNLGLLHLGEGVEQVLHGDGAEDVLLLLAVRCQLVDATDGGVAAELPQVRPRESLGQLSQPPGVNTGEKWMII